MNACVEFQLLGDFRAFTAAGPVELPKSKKTRALLAYLIVTNRPQRRERLCELFWETSNDPKAALRWSLSKLKKTADLIGCPFIEIDRERVRINSDAIDADLFRLRAIHRAKAFNIDDLDRVNADSAREFLIGLELPNLHAYTAWFASERDNTIDMRVALINGALAAPDTSPDKKIKYTKEWLELRPFDTRAAKELLNALKHAKRMGELASWRTHLMDRFSDAGIEFNMDQPLAAQREPAVSEARSLLSTQKIKFCKTSDGISLAYASTGNGPPLFKAANWLSHLELDWSAPIWSPLFKELSRDFQFIRYDERGNGLSDWDVKELSQTTFVHDLETVISQFQYERFPLLGISQGVAVCIDYAISNPGRVSKLVLFGGYPKGWRVDTTPDIRAVREAMLTLTKDGWGRRNPAYRHVFSSTFMPSATPEQLSWFDEFQRHTTSPENAVRFLEAFADIDVREKLSKIQVPTLVIHSRGDQRIDWAVGRDMASEIPGAEFVTLDSDNHLLLEGEPAADAFIAVVREFLKD
jgi:pimeloyl-ACP methyl ester carboxylesterase/DNA-binding SARP family transcriptional activator